MFVFGYVLQLGLLNRVLGEEILPPLLVTFGLSIMLQNGALSLFSADSRRLPTNGLESASIAVGPFAVGLMPLISRRCRRGHRRAKPIDLPYVDRTRLSSGLGRSHNRPTHGHFQSTDLRRGDGARPRRLCRGGVVSRRPLKF